MLDEYSRYKMMSEKLYDLVCEDWVSDLEDEDFICSMFDKTKRRLYLTNKQKIKLEELFIKY